MRTVKTRAKLIRLLSALPLIVTHPKSKPMASESDFKKEAKTLDSFYLINLDNY